jgi:sirohydrochlorin ferrochelatase
VTAPVLIACSHGTSSPEGRAAVSAIIDGARALLPGVEVVPSYVDVEYPQIDEVVAAVTARAEAVVVPVLLSSGYHTRVDIARAVAAANGRAVVTEPLGTHPLIAEIVIDRLVAAGATPHDAVVLAAAGSSDPASAAEVRRVAATVRARWGGPVAVGFAASSPPLLPEALATAREGGGRTVASSYVLAPGYFATVVRRAGFDLTSEPLGPDPRLASVVADRYRAAAGSSSADADGGESVRD